MASSAVSSFAFSRRTGARHARRPRGLSRHPGAGRAAFRTRGASSSPNPPPSSGGVLIGYGLSLLDRLGADGRPGSAEAIEPLVEVMREQSRARTGSFVGDLYRGGLARKLLAEENIRAALDRIERREASVPEAAGAPGTTHISVVDERGNAASLTASTGSGPV